MLHDGVAHCGKHGLMPPASCTRQALRRPTEADEEERKALTKAEERYRSIAMTSYRRRAPQYALLEVCGV